MPDSELETLCVDCHKLKHDFKEVTTMWTKALKVVKTKYDDDIVLYDIYFKNGLFEIDGCGNLNYLEDYRLREINDIYKSIGINIFELK